jgi:hypothetical protein
METQANIAVIFQSVWPVLGCICAGVIWLIRLEGKVKYIDRDLVILTEKHENLDSKIVNELSEIKQSLARLEGWLGIEHETRNNRRS